MLSISELSPKKRAFLTGTILLTGTGFACRVLGFFYRIFLSRTIGAEGLGIYNMIHPIFGICFALCAGSVQTALSQHIASHTARGRSIFRTGTVISMTMSFVLAFLICRHAEFLANVILMEPRCTPYMPIMGISVPFAAFHACINGYYYGMQKSHVPAFSQIVEQILRMTLVFFIADSWIKSGHTITVMLAAYGHLIGEIASSLFTLLCLLFFPPQRKDIASGFLAPGTAGPLMTLALPLMGNRLVLNLLSSAEAIWIPSRLQMSGLNNDQAFAVYGVLTGMALPFILFPSAITNSLAVLLLPSVAKDQAEGRKGSIAASMSLSLRYSLYMGILCIGIFTLFGEELGVSVFHDPDAGRFIRILAWLCPFLYLATTMGSILNGLGKTSVTFFQNVWAMVIRLAFVLFAIPRFGIQGYLWGMLASELALALMSFLAVKRQVPFHWDTANMIVKPVILLLISIGMYLAFSCVATSLDSLPLFVRTAVNIIFLCFCYMGLLLLFHKRKPLP